MPPSVFPVNSVKAMRMCLVLGDRLVPFATAVFEAYWGGDQDISQDAVLREICARVGLDADDLLAAQAADDIKAQLRANTDAVMARGGFGSPTIFIGGTDMYFGNDRLPLVRAALERARAAG
jgi:2-hydroxychromene-2-carboxylate isomerase